MEFSKNYKQKCILMFKSTWCSRLVVLLENSVKFYRDSKYWYRTVSVLSVYIWNIFKSHDFIFIFIFTIVTIKYSSYNLKIGTLYSQKHKFESYINTKSYPKELIHYSCNVSLLFLLVYIIENIRIKKKT